MSTITTLAHLWPEDWSLIEATLRLSFINLSPWSGIHHKPHLVYSPLPCLPTLNKTSALSTLYNKHAGLLRCCGFLHPRSQSTSFSFLSFCLYVFSSFLSAPVRFISRTMQAHGESWDLCFWAFWTSSLMCCKLKREVFGCPMCWELSTASHID